MSSRHYVYAICCPDMNLPGGIVGFEDAPLDAIFCRDLAAVTSIMRSTDLQPSPENALLHESVVEQIRMNSPAIPARFGTILNGPDGVRSALQKHYDTLHADLKRLGDKVEYGLTVLWNQPDNAGDAEFNTDTEPRDQGAKMESASVSSGLRYLQQRRQAYQKDSRAKELAEQYAKEIEKELGEIALEHSRTLLTTPKIPIRGSYLVDPERAGEFQERFDAVRRQRPELRFLLSGPWPPYSFVSSGKAGGSGSIAGLVQEASKYLLEQTSRST